MSLVNSPSGGAARRLQEALGLQTLAGRLSAWFIAASFLLVALTGTVLYFATVSAIDWADDQVLEKRMHTMRDILHANEPDPASIAHEVSEDLDGPRKIYVRVISDNPQLSLETPSMSEVLPSASFPDVKDVSIDAMQRATLDFKDKQDYRVLSVRVPVGGANGKTSAIVQIACDRTLDADLINWYRRLLGTLLLLCLPASILAGRYIVNHQLRPLKEIEAATVGISSKTLDYRLPIGGQPSEIEDLAKQFNLMLGRLDSAYTNLGEYADNIAHEIRTPINKMLLHSEVALMDAKSGDDYRDALESVMEEGQRLARLVQSLLFLARAERKQTVIMREPARISKEIENIGSYFDGAAAEKKIALNHSCQAGLTAEVDRVLFQRAVSNLVSNAIAHTPPGGTVDIRATATATGLQIEVCDNGEGIAADALAHIFDRFYRAGAERALDGDRLGLGLSITKGVVDLHGGTIHVESNVGQGTRVTLMFPENSLAAKS